MDSDLDYLARLYSNGSGLQKDEFGAQMAVTNHGYIPLPSHAAKCFVDYRRTFTFLKGVYHAVNDLLKITDELTILYAGCGPFSSLLTPILCLMKGQNISVYLLDFHQESLESSRQLFEYLNISRHLTEIIQADAVEHQFKDKESFDLIISETMQAGLRQENQVTITRNLSPYLKKYGCFIPQEVNVKGVLKSEVEETDLGEVYSLNHLKIPERGYRVNLNIPPMESESFLILETQIKIYEQFVLNSHDSGLTTPIILDKLNPSESPREICLSYEEKPSPGFKIKYPL